ncbi:MAG: ABC transporter ATP-binding protein [Kiritimatiellia bacterium]
MVLRCEAVHKSYRLSGKTIPVLVGAELAVEEGERVAIVGRSGAGKSTLLHLLGGLDRPQAGRVWLCGEDLYGVRATRRDALRAGKIGFVFQSYHLLPEMDLTENVMLPAMALGKLSRRAMRERAMDLLSEMGLADRAAHTPLELSGGEQQRVAIARALMNHPPVILADEPTGNLDRETGEQVLASLLKASVSRRHALVMVTHDPVVAARCDRMLRLEGGELIHEV